MKNESKAYINYNELIPLSYRKRLNKQQNKIKLVGKLGEDGRIIQPFRYVIGLGERHSKAFEKEILRLCRMFPWLAKKHARFIIHELILNSQFSMMREVVKKVPLKSKVPGYINLTIHVNNDFFSAGIEEFGDFFDYYNYINDQKDEVSYREDIYDDMSEEHLNSLDDLTDDKLKIMLTESNEIRVPDNSNKIGLYIIENATDHDFYITSFYKNGKYMWKRIYFRLENDAK